MHSKKMVLLGLLLLLCVGISFPLSVFLLRESEQTPIVETQVTHIPADFTPAVTPDFPPPIPDEAGTPPKVELVEGGSIEPKEFEAVLREQLSQKEYEGLVLRMKQGQATHEDEVLIQQAFDTIVSNKAN
jgi:hypothetical protein